MTEWTKLVRVWGDDWEGLYVDGALRLQGHSLDLNRVLEVLGIEMESVEADYGWLADVGQLPERLSDIHREGEEPDGK